MPSLTVRAEQERLDALDAEADERGISRAALIREIIDEREARENELDALKSERDELETEVKRLRREKRQILDQREEHSELVETVAAEQSLAERRANAGVLTRARWWLVGMGDEE